MRTSYNYIGCFFSPDILRAKVQPLWPQRLARPIVHPHVTFVYRPAQVDPSLFGTPVRVRAVSYGNDGVNEGLGVELFSDNPAIRAMIDAIPVPHITLSVSETGKPVNTCRLQFEPIPPFELTGVFGAFLTDGTVRITP